MPRKKAEEKTSKIKEEKVKKTVKKTVSKKTASVAEIKKENAKKEVKTKKKTTKKETIAKTTAKKTTKYKTSNTKKTEPKKVKKENTKKEAKKNSAKVTKAIKNIKKSISKKKKKEIIFSINGKTYFASTGKRKSSIAKVRLFAKGSGNIEINGKDIKEYFFGILIGNATQPLKILDQKKNFDLAIKVQGGGSASQSDAVRHGIAQALVKADASFRLPLKRAGFLTRDARVKERKKPGLKRARRAPQWKKR